MKNRYHDLMEQQKLSDQAKEAFFTKLQSAKTEKRAIPFYKAIAAAACLVLLIPVLVLAAEQIFGDVNVKRVENATVHDQPGIGYEVRFHALQSHPITDFSPQLQQLKETKQISYASWEAAQKDLGIGLLANKLCADGEAEAIVPYMAEEASRTTHCQGVYTVTDGQLSASRIQAAYKRSGVKFTVSARLTAERYSKTDGQQAPGFTYLYYQKADPKVTTEQYTTKNGIPVTVCIVQAEDSADAAGFTEYHAYFAVNDVAYAVSVIGCDGSWEDTHIYAVLCEVLEGFVIG